jgi:hypothetical protein
VRWFSVCLSVLLVRAKEGPGFGASLTFWVWTFLVVAFSRIRKEQVNAAAGGETQGEARTRIGKGGANDKNDFGGEVRIQVLQDVLKKGNRSGEDQQTAEFDSRLERL